MEKQHQLTGMARKFQLANEHGWKPREYHDRSQGFQPRILLLLRELDGFCNAYEGAEASISA
jgi:hypothetical protein